MPAKDLFHDCVKNALIEEGWTITDDPFPIRVGSVEMYIDLGAEKIIAAEKADQKIAVEIKTFSSPSTIYDFHLGNSPKIIYQSRATIKDCPYSQRGFVGAIPCGCPWYFIFCELP